jgi:hypothetical protein
VGPADPKTSGGAPASGANGGTDEPPAPSSPDPETGVGTPSGRAGDPDQPDTVPMAAVYPAWAKDELPPRPFLDNPIGKNYPPCVAKLRKAAARDEIDSEQAERCYNQLHAFNSFAIIPYVRRRESYIPALKDRADNEPDQARWSFLSDEYSSFTHGTDWERFERLNQVFTCDNHLLINLKDHNLNKERWNCPKTLLEESD